MTSESKKPETSAPNSLPDNVRSLPAPGSTTGPVRPRMTQDGKRMAFKPRPGLAHNPLLTLPRNNPCPCMSGKKFKTCCLPRLPPVVPEAQAEFYKERMRAGSITFMTEENQPDMVARLSVQRAKCKHVWEDAPSFGGKFELTCKACLLTKREYEHALAAAVQALETNEA